MRWKLLAAFALAFTLVFGFIALWVIQFSANNAMDRLTGELEDTAAGGARILNARAFQRLVDTVPAVKDPTNPSGYGYPDSALFRAIAEQLYRIRDIDNEALPYTYYRDPDDGKLYFVASSGYLDDPQFGVTYLQPVADVSEPETIARMESGLLRTTNEPAYTDAYGSWISSYSPILTPSGGVVGAIGIDYPLAYVEQTRVEARNRVIPVLLASYIVLLLLVLVVSGMVVRPLRRLTEATHRIAEGEYDLDVHAIVRSRFPDEMFELGESFQAMARKVGARERTLTSEVQRLRVEIDATKRAETVKEITETDFFAQLQTKAAEMRRRMHDDEEA